jgi:hypothetical protein
MSHFTTIQTQLVVKDYLKKALDDLEYNWEEGNLEVRGYQGNRTRAEIRLETGNPGYDIGFRKQDQNYEVVADWWGIKNIKQEEFVQQVNRRYAYHAVKDQLEQQDFSFVEEEIQEDNSIRISVRRMS